MVFFAPEERENLVRREEPEGRHGAGFESPNECAPIAGRENLWWNTVGHCDSRARAGAQHPVTETGGKTRRRRRRRVLPPEERDLPG
jgi:hypothetical protein